MEREKRGKRGGGEEDWRCLLQTEDTSTCLFPSLILHSSPLCPLLSLLIDSDMAEYNNLLRNGVLDAYSGVIQVRAEWSPAELSERRKGTPCTSRV